MCYSIQRPAYFQWFVAEPKLVPLMFDSRKRGGLHVVEPTASHRRSAECALPYHLNSDCGGYD